MTPATAIPAKPRRLLRVLTISLVFLFLLCAVLFALACWPPAVMKVSIPDEELLASALSFERKLETVLDARISKEPVPISITAEEINGYCAALQRNELWSQLPIQDEEQRVHWRSPQITDVRIYFASNQAWVSGTVADTRLPLVISFRLKPGIRPDGSVSFALTGVRIGHLPIPTAIAKRFFKPLDDIVMPQKGPWVVKHLGIKGNVLYILAGPKDNSSQ